MEEPKEKLKKQQQEKKKHVEVKTPKGIQKCVQCHSFDDVYSVGTRDYGPEETKVREEVMSKIVSVFKRHGAVSIETPVFELKEVLFGQYGEDEKLIYDLADQGGEICALRYDLTVPFSRFVAQNNVKQIKKYQIGRVYRRDLPHMTKGRYREFYQCDFDIAGEFGSMMPDSECLVIMKECLATLNVGDFVIKVNHRSLLDGIFALCGVPANLFVPICSAVDKLDKLPWQEVRAEMTMKGLDEDVADKIWSYVSKKGEPEDMLKQLESDEALMALESAKTAVAEMNKLFQYLRAFKSDKVCSFDLSLARGLSYYTGVIFEAVLMNKDVHVGSVGGGGRYDKLVGRFKKKGDVPCVGFSIGIERLFTVMMELNKKKPAQGKTDTVVLVCALDSSLLLERMQLVAELWEMGVCAEILLKDSPKIQAQLKYAESSNIPFSAIIGPEEIADGTVNLKNMGKVEDGEDKQVRMSRKDFLEKMKTYTPSN